jgi:hypothetical protein
MTKISTYVAFNPFAPLGFTSYGPIMPVAGGRGSGIEFVVGDDDGADPDFDDDDEDEDEDDEPRSRRRDRDDDDDDRQRDDTDQDGDWTPPSRQAFESVQDALTRANREAMSRRQVGKLMKKLGVQTADEFAAFLADRGIDVEDAGDGDGEGRTERRGDRPRNDKTSAARAEARAAARYKSAVVNLAAENAFTKAGWAGENLALAMRMIDPSRVDVEFDDDGQPSIDGLEEQIEEVKNDFPMLFRGNGKRAARQRAGGVREVDGGNRERPPAQKLTWDQKLSRQLGGR